MKYYLLFILAIAPHILLSQTRYEHEFRFPDDTSLSTMYLSDLIVGSDHKVKVLGRYINASGNYLYGNFIADLGTDGQLSNFIFFRGMHYASTLIESKNGGYIIAGDDIDLAFLARIDENGKILWQKHYENDDEVEAYRAVETSTGDILFAGEIDDRDDYHYFVKTNADGDTLWTKSFIDEGEVYDMDLMPDDGSVSVGDAWTANGFGKNDLGVIRLDKDGTPLWIKILGDSEAEYASSIAYADPASILIAGTLNYMDADSITMKSDAFLINLDLDGNIQWAQRLNYAGGNDYGAQVIEDCHGNYVMAVKHFNEIDSTSSVALCSFSPDGELRWARELGHDIPNIASITNLIESPDEGFLIGGYSTRVIQNNFYQNSIFLIKTDEEGNSCASTDIPLSLSPLAFDSGDNTDQGWFDLDVYDANFADGADTFIALDDVEHCKDFLPIVQNDSLTLFPNPNNGSFALRQAGCYDGAYEIIIYDALGQLVYDLKSEAGKLLPRSLSLPLHTGLYVLEIDEEETQMIRKFLVY